MNTVNLLPLMRRIAPVFVLAFGIAALIPTAACAVPPSGENGAEATEEANEGDLVAMLPVDASTLGFIDFAAIRETATYEFLRDDTGIGSDEWEEMIARTGIDPRTDLHRIAFISGDTVGTWDDSAAFLVLADFDAARIQESVSEAPVEEYSGRTLFQVGALDMDDMQLDGEGDDGDDSDMDINADFDGWMTLLTDTIMAFGSSESIRAVVDVADGAASARDNDALMSLLEDVDTGAQVWAVSAQEGLLSGITPEAGTPMGSIGYDRINAMIVALDMGDGLSFRMRGRTDAEEDAKNIGDALTGMVALGKMMLQGSSPEIFEILDQSIDTGSRGRDVTLNATLSIEDLQVLRDYANDMLSDFENPAGEIGG